MAKTMFFQLLVGGHQDRNEVNYSAGDIIECEEDLVKMFGSAKFQKLSSQQCETLKQLKENRRKARKRVINLEPA